MNTVHVRLPRKLSKNVSGGVLAEEGRLHPVGALNITLNLQPLSRVTMTLAEDDLPLAMHDLVEVYNQNGSVGVYRVVKPTNNYRKERRIELSHGLDVFSDSTFSAIEKYSGTVAGFLQKIVDAQTQTIGGTKYWRLGTCADTNYWEKDIKYDNLMSCLTEIAKAEEDYMFTFDQSTFPWTLNFVARNDTVLSEFRLSRNTSSCSITLDDSDLCTRLYLSVSKENEDSAGNGTYWEDGYFVYNDTAAQAEWGIVCKTAGVDQSVSAPDVDKATWVARYFSRHNTPNAQITIDGAELHKLTGESFDEVHMGRMCRTALPDYNTIFNERVISVNYPDALRSPTSVKVSLANKRLTAEDAFSEINSTAKSAASSARSGGRGAHNDATYFRRTIGDTANGLYSRIEQTACYIRSEIVDTANGLYSKIEQTASYIRSEVSDTANGLSSRIEQNSSQIALRVAKGDVLTQLAVEAGNVTVSGGNLVVDGYITSSGLATEIANISVLSVQAIAMSGGLSSSGDIRSGGTVAGAELYRAGTDMGNAFVALSDPGYSGNSKTITFTKANGGTETITFSRAISSNSWSWVNGHASVTLQPQNQTFTSPNITGYTASGDPTYDSTTKLITQNIVVTDEDGASVASLSVNVSGSQAWSAGNTSGIATGKAAMGVAADTANHAVKVVEGNTSSLEITCEKVSIVYSAANHNYAYVFHSKAGSSVVASTSGTTDTDAFDAGVTAGEGHFSLASVTLQGAAHSVTPISGTALRLGSDVTVTPIGTTSVRLGSAGTYYEAGSLTSYYRGNGGSFTVQGESVSVTPIVTTSVIRLGTKTTIDGKQYYPVVSSGGTFYYQKGSQTTYYKAGTTTKYARGDSISVTPIAGGGITCRPVLSSGGTVFYRAGTPEVYMPVLSSGGTEYFKAGTPLNLYDAGSTITDVYYTKTA